MIELFPYKWVIVIDGVFELDELIKGKLVAVCEDDEFHSTLEKILKENKGIRPYCEKTKDYDCGVFL